MPRIFDNIDLSLQKTLQETLKTANRADFCVGYFNLRGWRLVEEDIDKWTGDQSNRCRILIGMQRLPQDELRETLRLDREARPIDLQAAALLRRRVAEEFREQLAAGAPSNSDELVLRRLSEQLRAGKVVVKLYLRQPLHAKLYLLHRDDYNNPTIGFVGSSNLTFSGLTRHGELNVDVLDHDSCTKLQAWYDARWNDRFSVDITDELADIIDTSWAREVPPSPYEVYLKIAYHLSREARTGLSEYGVPREFRDKLLGFQAAAVKIAAHHLNKRGGVLIGDVVGLGKTIMAVALARLFQDDQGTNTLIICPPKLMKMWQRYVDRFGLIARVISLGAAPTALKDMPRYRVVLIDESHNLRNREGVRYRAIREYIEQNDSRCILLSATPYNKSYLDLSAQLRLFVPEHADLGIRPERLMRSIGETEFVRKHQAPLRSLAAFEQSPFADDWRDLMRLFLIRRTRSFIQDNYADLDPETNLRYLTFPNGDRHAFPIRTPRTIKFDSSDSTDPYYRLHSDNVVDAIAKLKLPRYGLAGYIDTEYPQQLSGEQGKTVARLSRAGARLMGFCRTNLFKRLESGGPAFISSLYRHLLRNEVLLYALKTGQSVPIGSQDASLLDTDFSDSDDESVIYLDGMDQSLEKKAIADRAKALYEHFSGEISGQFRWLPSSLFTPRLTRALSHDARLLRSILADIGDWDPDSDTKLRALIELVGVTHAQQKMLIFTQFADTAAYLRRQLTRATCDDKEVEVVTGSSDDPTAAATRFSPRSNEANPDLVEERRVLIATDVLSEGQNLQDCHVMVNYDLPWAIIRLIQRAGRIDRIGQASSEILCYSFMPSEGVERLIQLRQRVNVRLRQSAAVLGTDEQFFEDEEMSLPLEDLYNEKSGVLDGEADSEVDLASYAYQIWKNAIDQNPSLATSVPDLPPVTFSAKDHTITPNRPPGVLVYVRTTDDNDVLAYIADSGESITQSQLEILEIAACRSDTPTRHRAENHHELVESGVRHVLAEEATVGGQLGRPSGARFKAYERLSRYLATVRGTLFESQELLRVVDDIYRYPLQQHAVDAINRQLRAGISDENLSELMIALRDESRLSIIEDTQDDQDPQLICSMGLL